VQVIGVDAGDELAPGQFKTTIEVDHQTLVLRVAHDPKPTIRLSDMLEKLCGSVRGRVVNRYQLQRRSRLRQHRRDSWTNEAAAIKHRQEDRYAW
jgi:hypothetical protein